MAMFGKRHYEVVARLLSMHYTTNHVHDGAVDAIAEDFAGMFAYDNPRFDSDRFHKAVGSKNVPSRD